MGLPIHPPMLAGISCGPGCRRLGPFLLGHPPSGPEPNFRTRFKSYQSPTLTGLQRTGGYKPQPTSLTLSTREKVGL
jgi:hypothetical protein